MKTKLLASLLSVLLLFAACSSVPPSAKYVASKSSDKYHTLDCTSAKRIKEKNRIYYSTPQSAEKDGKFPCSRCLP